MQKSQQPLETLETLVIEIEQDANREVLARTARAMEFLVAEIKEAYARPSGTSPEGVPLGFKASHGASGAIGALNYEVARAGAWIEGIIGVSTANKYLANLEFGERGTQGGPPGGALFDRSKAPPIRNIAQWIHLANLQIDENSAAYKRAMRYRAMAESGHPHPSYDQNKDKPWYSTDPSIQLAFMIAMKRKRLGRPAMRVIERTAREHAEKIKGYLQGSR